jgi:hypothetical protein
LRFFIIDPSLYDSGGHNLDYAKAVVTVLQNQGIEAIVLANKQFSAQSEFPIAVTPVFSQGLREPASITTRIMASAFHRARAAGRVAGLHIPRFEPLAGRARRLAQELAQWACSISFQRDDKLFFPTITWRDAVAILEFYNTLNTLPELHIILRFDPPEAADARMQLRDAACKTSARLTLWADTPELAAIYKEITGRSLRLVRMPFFQSSEPAKAGHPYLLYLGEARADKGFLCLPYLADQLCKHLPDKDLVVQLLSDPNSNSAVTSAVNSLTQLEHPQIKLLHGPLNSSTFDKLICGAGAVLCLHDPETYRYRSAGIVTQAIAAGVPVIMRRGNSSPLSMIIRNACDDLVHFVDGNGARDWESIAQALDTQASVPRVLDCTSLWDAPWLNLKR